MSRRALIVCHPSFDEKGAAGIRAAEEYARQLAEGTKNTLKQAGDIKMNPEIAKLRRYLKGFKFKLRLIPDDVL